MASTAKHDWSMVPLPKLVQFQSGGTPSTKNPEYYNGEIPWVTSADISESHCIDAKKFITEAAIRNSAACIAQPGSVLLVTRIGVGKSALVEAPVSFSQDVTNLTDLSEECDARYLLHFLQSARSFFQSRSRGVTIKGIKRTDLNDLLVPLPPLDEQRRIAAILDEVGRLSSIQIKKVEGLEALKRVVVEEFLKARGDQEVELGTISEIQSGITKGRKVSKKSTTSIVPYLSVSNVKDGFLQLHPIKEINATNDEISRYQLQRGDIVLTEGGDPDKLGRGTVWNNEIPVCIHQNHIFRVRIRQDSTVMTPEVLAAILSSSRPKKHFLRSAKQTTGIASINKSQLSRTPIPNLTRDDVRALSLQIELLKLEQERAETQRSSFEELRQSLSTRAFQGEL